MYAAGHITVCQDSTHSIIDKASVSFALVLANTVTEFMLCLTLSCGKHISAAYITNRILWCISHCGAHFVVCVDETRNDVYSRLILCTSICLMGVWRCCFKCDQFTKRSLLKMILSIHFFINYVHTPTFVGPLTLTNDKIYGPSYVCGTASGPLYFPNVIISST